jgi:hypothetical protein
MLDQINSVLDILRQNPILLGFIIGILRNIIGYTVECFNAKKIVKYEGMKLLETLALYEGFFIALGSVANLPATWTTIAALAVDMIRSVKKAIATPTTPTPT